MTPKRRYWLLRDRITTSRELQASGISPVRCVDLGRAASLDEANRRAQRWLAANTWDDAAVAASNARTLGDAADNATCAKFGVRISEVDAMMRGEAVVIEDTLGEIKLGWSLLKHE